MPKENKYKRFRRNYKTNLLTPAFERAQLLSVWWRIPLEINISTSSKRVEHHKK
jgi:hypothetical protein